MSGLMDDKPKERTPLRIVDDKGEPVEPFVPLYMHVPLTKSTKRAYDEASKSRGAIARPNIIVTSVGGQRTLYTVDDGAYWEGPFNSTYDLTDFKSRETKGVQTQTYINFTQVKK